MTGLLTPITNKLPDLTRARIRAVGERVPVVVVLVRWPVTREQRLRSAQDLIDGEQIVCGMALEKVDGRSGH